MTKKKKTKRIVYPVSLTVELLDLLLLVQSMHLAATKAGLIREALQIGLTQLMEKKDV